MVLIHLLRKGATWGQQRTSTAHPIPEEFLDEELIVTNMFAYMLNVAVQKGSGQGVTAYILSAWNGVFRFGDSLCGFPGTGVRGTHVSRRETRRFRDSVSYAYLP